MAVVSQDSKELRSIAGVINSAASDFEEKYNALFQKLQDQLTEAESEISAWWGPQATAFYEEISGKKLQFQNAKANLNSMATNLEEQAQAWDTFEAV